MNMVVAAAFIIIVSVAYALFKNELWMLLKRFSSLLVKDMSKTLEGAEIIYKRAIAEKQQEFNKASYTLQQITGTLSHETTKLKNLKTTLCAIEKKCENLVSSGHMEQARLSALERQGVINGIASCTQNIENLEQAAKEAKEAVDIFENQLNNLKREMNQVVNDLKVGEQLADAYNSLDGLKKSEELYDLIDTVKDSAKEKKAKAAGARIIHENKLSTRINMFDDNLKDMESDDYLNSLQQKLNINVQENTDEIKNKTKDYKDLN
jgi:phage shock protein A